MDVLADDTYCPPQPPPPHWHPGEKILHLQYQNACACIFSSGLKTVVPPPSGVLRPFDLYGRKTCKYFQRSIPPHLLCVKSHKPFSDSESRSSCQFVSSPEIETQARRHLSPPTIRVVPLVSFVVFFVFSYPFNHKTPPFRSAPFCLLPSVHALTPPYFLVRSCCTFVRINKGTLLESGTIPSRACAFLPRPYRSTASRSPRG